MLFISIFLFLPGCGGDEIPGEDWDDYAEVYSGKGPDEDFEKLFLKINYGPKRTLNGEFEGTFFAKVEGFYFIDLQANKIFSLNSEFRSNQCFGKTTVEFEGTVVDNEITGIIYYNGCQIYEFFYQGEIVGGLDS